MPDIVRFVFVIIVLLLLGALLWRIWFRASTSQVPRKVRAWWGRGKRWVEVKRPLAAGNGTTVGPGARTELARTRFFLEVKETLGDGGPPPQMRYFLREGLNKIGRAPAAEQETHLIRILDDLAISANHGYLEFDKRTQSITWRSLDKEVLINDQDLVEMDDARVLQPNDILKLGNTYFLFTSQAHHPSGPPPGHGPGQGSRNGIADERGTTRRWQEKNSASAKRQERVDDGMGPIMVEHWVDEAPSGTVHQATQRAMDYVQRPRALFQVVEGPHSQQEFPYQGGRVLIGREKVDWYLDKDGKVSRQHAEVMEEGNAVRIRDLGSQWKLLINDHLTESRVLEEGDRIRLGDSVLLFLPLDK